MGYLCYSEEQHTPVLILPISFPQGILCFPSFHSMVSTANLLTHVKHAEGRLANSGMLVTLQELFPFLQGQVDSLENLTYTLT